MVWYVAALGTFIIKINSLAARSESERESSLGNLPYVGNFSKNAGKRHLSEKRRMLGIVNSMSSWERTLRKLGNRLK